MNEGRVGEVDWTRVQVIVAVEQFKRESKPEKSIA